MARFKHNFGYLLVIVVAYATTKEANDVDKGVFYQQFEQSLKTIYQNDHIICLDDFNAVTGTSRLTMENVIGPYGSGTRNDNTERILNFCLGVGLRAGGSWLKRKDIQKYTWSSNDGVIAKEIDSILVNTHPSALQNCSVYRSLEFDTDHRPVIATVSLGIKRTSEKKHKHYVIAWRSWKIVRCSFNT